MSFEGVYSKTRSHVRG